MSDKLIGKPPPAAIDPLQPNLVIYQILKRAPVLAADGTVQYQIVAQAQDFVALMNAAAGMGEVAVVAQICVAKLTAAPAPAPKP